MKKKLSLLKTAVGVGAAGYLVCDLVSNLITNRKFVIPQQIGDMVAGANMDDVRALREDYMNRLESHGYERYTMTTDDGVKLEGYLMRPEKPSNVYVFAAHGYRSTGKGEYCGFSQYYLDRGYNIFFVDHRAAGESEGNYIGFGYFEHRDCLKWLEFMNETFGKDISIILHGVSMGSATVMLMSGSPDLPENVKLVVADCGYTSAWNEFEFKLSSMHIPAWPLLPAVNKLNIRKAGYDFRDTSAINAVRKAKTPFLFVHGGADDFVPTYMAYQLYDACASKEKELMIIDGADHASSFVKDRPKYEAKLDEVISKYVLKTNV